MRKFHSTDLRERLVLAVESGPSRHQASARFDVSPSWAIRWHKSWRETGLFSAAARASPLWVPQSLNCTRMISGLVEEGSSAVNQGMLSLTQKNRPLLEAGF